MDYTIEMEIEQPRSEVIAKYNDLDFRKEWQKGLVNRTLIQGEENQTGAVSKLTFEMNNRTFEMTETITLSDLPDAIHLTFDAKNVYNIQENYFEEVTDQKTKWICKNEFRFSGFMKIMGMLMPGAFKKQTRKYMNDFKNSVEEGKSVNTLT